MNASHQDESGNEPASGTLGDLLYADKTKLRLSESDWLALLRAIAAGDQFALRALYERTHRIVFTLILRITGSRHNAEELTLDVFHEVWRRAGNYVPATGSVVGWILNLARSRAIDRLRFEGRKKRVKPEIDGTLPAQGDLSEDLDVAEQVRLLRESMNALTADERQAIEAAFFSELTHEEVAGRLNQPLGTVKTRIRSGLAKLRHHLARRTRQ